MKLKYIKGKPDHLNHYETKTKDNLSAPKGMISIHSAARHTVNNRWNLKAYHIIAEELGISTLELRKLRTTQAYENQIWATYGKTPYLFNKHKKREKCIEHIIKMFGISKKKANRILGNDWEKNLPQPKQLKLNF